MEEAVTSPSSRFYVIYIRKGQGGQGGQCVSVCVCLCDGWMDGWINR